MHLLSSVGIYIGSNMFKQLHKFNMTAVVLLRETAAMHQVNAQCKERGVQIKALYFYSLFGGVMTLRHTVFCLSWFFSERQREKQATSLINTTAARSEFQDLSLNPTDISIIIQFPPIPLHKVVLCYKTAALQLVGLQHLQQGRCLRAAVIQRMFRSSLHNPSWPSSSK